MEQSAPMAITLTGGGTASAFGGGIFLVPPADETAWRPATGHWSAAQMGARVFTMDNIVDSYFVVDNTGTELVTYFGTAQSVRLPAGITTIRAHAFRSNMRMNEIIAEDVEFVLDDAFHSAAYLTRIFWSSHDLTGVSAIGNFQLTATGVTLLFHSATPAAYSWRWVGSVPTAW